MNLARLAVFGAILCTLWFNGSYAWSRGSSELQQYGMGAVALTIDLCKCGFLPAASHLWRNAWRLPAIILCALWPLAFAYSTFSGYASITSNRSATTAIKDNARQIHDRAQADYDDATATLKAAKASALWDASAACTAPKTEKHRTFCTNIKSLETRQSMSSDQLRHDATQAVDPEVTILTATTGLTASALSLLIALVPALILELVSSLGFYAVYQRHRLEPPRASAEPLSKADNVVPAPPLQNTSTASPVAPQARSHRPSPTVVDWSIP